MKVWLSLLAGAVLVGAALVYLVPLDDQTCPQVYEDFYGRNHDPMLGQGTPFLCWGEIRRQRARLEVPAQHRRSFSADETDLLTRFRAGLCPKLSGSERVSVSLVHGRGDTFLGRVEHLAAYKWYHVDGSEICGSLDAGIDDCDSDKLAVVSDAVIATVSESGTVPKLRAWLGCD